MPIRIDPQAQPQTLTNHTEASTGQLGTDPAAAYMRDSNRSARALLPVCTTTLTSRRRDFQLFKGKGGLFVHREPNRRWIPAPQPSSAQRGRHALCSPRAQSALDPASATVSSSRQKARVYFQSAGFNLMFASSVTPYEYVALQREGSLRGPFYAHTSVAS